MILAFVLLDSYAWMCLAVFVAGASLASISPVSLALPGCDRKLRRYEPSDVVICNSFYARSGSLLGPLVSSPQLFSGPKVAAADAGSSGRDVDGVRAVQHRVLSGRSAAQRRRGARDAAGLAKRADDHRSTRLERGAQHSLTSRTPEKRRAPGRHRHRGTRNIKFGLFTRQLASSTKVRLATDQGQAGGRVRRAARALALAQRGVGVGRVPVTIFVATSVVPGAHRSASWRWCGACSASEPLSCSAPAARPGISVWCTTDPREDRPGSHRRRRGHARAHQDGHHRRGFSARPPRSTASPPRARKWVA